MEIKINNLEDINLAARTFIDNMGKGRVFAFYGKWAQARQHSSRPYAKIWV